MNGASHVCETNSNYRDNSLSGPVIFLGRIRRNFDIDASACCSTRSHAHSSIFQSHNPPTADTHAAHKWANLFSLCPFPPSPKGQDRIKSEPRDAPKEAPLTSIPPFRRARTDHNQRGTAGARRSGHQWPMDHCHCPMGGGCLFKLKLFGFRQHAAPRKRHTRNRVSARRLREIDPVWGFHGRLGAVRIWHAHTCQAASRIKKMCSETVVF